MRKPKCGCLNRLYETEFEDGCELPYIYLGDADDELHFW